MAIQNNYELIIDEQIIRLKACKETTTHIVNGLAKDGCKVRLSDPVTGYIYFDTFPGGLNVRN